MNLHIGPSLGQVYHRNQTRGGARDGHLSYQCDSREDIHPDPYCSHNQSSQWAPARFNDIGGIGQGRVVGECMTESPYGSGGQSRNAAHRQSGGNSWLVSAKHRDPSIQENRTTKAEESLTFDRAISKLSQQIVKSEAFYRKFKSEYENDVRSILEYATEETLLALWILRIEGKKRPSAATDNPSADNDELIETADKFPIMQEKLLGAFAKASGSKLDETIRRSPKGSIRYRSAKRLKEKVMLAHSQISTLLKLVKEAPEYCENLVDELSAFKAVLEFNQTKKNAAMYKVPEVDVDTIDGDDGW